MDAPSSCLFLDLEDTVIDDWFSGLFLPSRIQKIWALARNHDRLGLFSWAVHNQKDVETFNKQFRPHLERELEKEFDDRFIVTVQQCQEMMCWQRNINPNTVKVTDFFDFWGDKALVFNQIMPRFSRQMGLRDIMLIDDTIDHDMSVVQKDLNMTLLNVLRL